MLKIKFKYKDTYSHGNWIKQQCYVSTLSECIDLYGLGKDCDYKIISVEEVK